MQTVTIDIYNSTDESWKSYAEWRKPDIKGYILLILFIWNLRVGKVNVWNENQHSGCLRKKWDFIQGDVGGDSVQIETS